MPNAINRVTGKVKQTFIPGKDGNDDRTAIAVYCNEGNTAVKIKAGSYFGDTPAGLLNLQDGATGTVAFIEVGGKGKTFRKPVSFEPVQADFEPEWQATRLYVEERKTKTGNRYAAVCMLPDGDAPAIQMSGVFEDELIDRFLDTDIDTGYLVGYAHDGQWLEPLEVMEIPETK